MKNFFLNIKVIALISVGIIGSAFVLLQDNDAEMETFDLPLRAAIIDQLYEDYPNEDFHQKATEYFETAGYQVDVFTTESITVDFYKSLPKKNYQFVVVRTHGVVGSEDNSVMLFTGERYTEDQYIQEQLFGHVLKGTPFLERSFEASKHDSSEWVIVNDTYRYLKTPVQIEDDSVGDYFVISPKLVSESMDGKFPGTIFVLGGCNTMQDTSMAESLVKRGASAVVGWEIPVSSGQNDWTLLKVLKETLINDMDIKDAVDFVRESKFRHSPNDWLKYYSDPSA